MVHCIYERVIKLKRNFKKLYIVFCCYCCCLQIRICCSKPLKGVLAFAVITSTFATVTGFLWLPDQSRHGLLQYLMFGTESHYICPFRNYSKRCIKKLKKGSWHWPHSNPTFLSVRLNWHKTVHKTNQFPVLVPFRGHFKIVSHPHWSPLRVESECKLRIAVHAF